MKREFLLLALIPALLSGFSGLSQDPLTLEEAVARAYPDFYPERLQSLTWVPDTDTYCYQTGEGPGAVVMRGYTDDKKDEELFSLATIRDAFLKAGFVQPESIPAFEWIDSEKVLFSFMGLNDDWRNW